MSSRDLILTIMQGYDYPFVEPFFESLKKVGYRGDLVVFVSDDLSKATRKKLETTQARLIGYKTAFPFIDAYSDAFNGITPSVSINNYRFIFYLQYLKEYCNDYDRVMLTDIRDVVFQLPPFSVLRNDSISFFLEDEAQTFRHKFNYEWLANATDRDTADSVADQQVSCAGITIGGSKEIIKYLEYMKAKLTGRDKLEWGLDQGIHNSYIYVKNPAGIKVFGSDKPYVINLGAYQPYHISPGGEVTTASGEPYAIVHQYDRSGKLFGLVKNKYIGNRLTQRLKRLYYLLMP
jgi:hypothetical protein